MIDPSKLPAAAVEEAVKIDPYKLPAAAVKAAHDYRYIRIESRIAAFLNALLADDEAMDRGGHLAINAGSASVRRNAFRTALIAAVQKPDK